MEQEANEKWRKSRKKGEERGREKGMEEKPGSLNREGKR